MKLLNKNNFAAAFEILAIVLLFNHTYVPQQKAAAQAPPAALVKSDTSNLFPSASSGTVRFLENFAAINKK